MSNKYKIKVGETQVPEKVIEKHKNFAEVMTSYREITRPWYKIPLYKNPKAFLGLVMIVALAFLVFEAVSEEEKAAENDGKVATVMPNGANSLPEFETLLLDSLNAALPVEAVPPTPEAINGSVPGVPMKPVMPIIADTAAFHFDLSFDPAEYPELSGSQGAVWEYTGTSEEMDPRVNTWALEQEWETIEINRKDDHHFEMIFRNEEKSFITLASPAFGEKYYPAAKEKYKKELRDFYAAWVTYLSQGS